MSLDTQPETSPEPSRSEPGFANSANDSKEKPTSQEKLGTSTGLSEITDQQWRRLRKKMDDRLVKDSAAAMFGEAAVQRGSIYRWGVACARDGEIDDLTHWLSYLASDLKPPKKLSARIDLDRSARDIIESVQSLSYTPSSAASAVIWAAAMPALATKLDSLTWWDLLSTLQQLRESIIQRNQFDTPVQLLVAGELGLTLAWRLADLPSCKRLRASSAQAVERWCSTIDDSIAMSVSGSSDARLVLASLLRCRRLTSKSKKKRSSKNRIDAVSEELATWTIALTTHTGSTAFSKASRKDVVDDLADGGLLDQAVSLDRESLQPALKAALGKTQSGGRLAWQICLPESMHLSEDAKIAVMMPDWDVRRGRTHVDYRHDDIRLEVFGGRQLMLSGRWNTIIELDQDEQQPRGQWELTCEYSDDDVHYLELEQHWSGGILLQRQFLMVRDDRCLMLADSVTRDDMADDPMQGHAELVSASGPTGNLRYISRFPIAADVHTHDEEATREIYLEQGRNRAMVMPLAACEWRNGLSRTTLEATPDHHLALTTRGRDRLFAPLWIDFQQRRFNRKRTWRQLTIADERRIVDESTAAGFRVQVGSEQWMLYRSLAGNRCRTVLGKHLLADFFCGRFDTGDGSIEELITVDDRASSDE
tara:strand:+ start:464517 stop:466463 length:1947 start_codon:yes stop_codon:yes gene_type:complete